MIKATPKTIHRIYANCSIDSPQKIAFRQQYGNNLRICHFVLLAAACSLSITTIFRASLNLK
jgi:hypothetical protein